MQTTRTYQVMRPLSEEEYAALKASIAERGVEIPLVVDVEGAVIDGHHRRRAVAELKADGHKIGNPPEIVREDLETEAEKLDEAWRLNMQRRHLDQAQKRDAIADKLKESPQWADNRIAHLLGVDSKTVRSVRTSLEEREELSKVELLEGKDGKYYPRNRSGGPSHLNRASRHDDDVEKPMLEVAGKAYTSQEIELLITEAEESKRRLREVEKVERSKQEPVRQQEQERQAYSERVKANAARQIADYQARYNIPEIPEIFQSKPEDFQRFLRNATDGRQREALGLLSEAMKLVGRMMRFEPEEAANGFLRWNDRDRAREAMERYIKWLNQCWEEIRAQTTPGRLRVLGDGVKKDKRG